MPARRRRHSGLRGRSAPAMRRRRSGTRRRRIHRGGSSGPLRLRSGRRADSFPDRRGHPRQRPVCCGWSGSKAKSARISANRWRCPYCGVRKKPAFADAAESGRFCCGLVVGFEGVVRIPMGEEGNRLDAGIFEKAGQMVDGPRQEQVLHPRETVGLVGSNRSSFPLRRRAARRAGCDDRRRRPI